MDLRDTGAEAEFRAEVRAWVTEAVAQLGPRPANDDYRARRVYDSAWQRAQFDAGYAGIHWPADVGGRGATPAEHLIFLEELARAGAPDEGVSFVGLLHAGPTLIAEGTIEQRRTHLPAILRGDEVWCQGFSEPEAGSDLASLRTRAVRDGDSYVVSGHKIWTSYASVADQCELLVRTDPDAPKHRGLSWLIMPMDSPGVEIRPLRTIDGTVEFAELFLDEVRIPVANLVGDEHDGWRVAMVTFAFERGTAFVGKLLEAMSHLDRLVMIAGQPWAGRVAWSEPSTRRELSALAAELDALWAWTRRNVSRAQRGTVDPATASAYKLTFAEVAQRLAAVTVDVLGPAASVTPALDQPEARRLVGAALYSFAFSIAAGTSQIQRDIIAERGLGLPRVRA